MLPPYDYIILNLYSVNYLLTTNIIQKKFNSLYIFIQKKNLNNFKFKKIHFPKNSSRYLKLEYTEFILNFNKLTNQTQKKFFKH